jgi:sensor histidine kinase YesM
MIKISDGVEKINFLIENHSLDGLKSDLKGTGLGLSTVRKLLDLKYSEDLNITMGEKNQCSVKFSISKDLCK